MIKTPASGVWVSLFEHGSFTGVLDQPGGQGWNYLFGQWGAATWLLLSYPRRTWKATLS
jgi:hypothetical protein